MNGEKTSVTVRIAGEEHTIRASAEPSYTRRCAALVDDRIHQIRLQAGLIEGHKAAILAALSIAD
jgi:cell division protein ZapA (FtsZ GTPase activity inhibitor)